MNNEDLKKLSEEIGGHLSEAGIPPDKIDVLRKKLIKLQEEKQRKLVAAEVVKALFKPVLDEVLEEKLIGAIRDIKIEPQITVEPTAVTIPPVKIISKEIPPPRVTVSPPKVIVNEKEVKFPKEMAISGFPKLLAALRERITLGLDKITRKNPLPVVLVFDSKTYKAIGGEGVGAVLGGGPSRLYLKNIDNETAQVVEEVKTPTIYNVSITVPDTEFSQALPDKTRKVKIKLRGLGADLKIAWASGESGTVYVNVPRGMVWVEDGLKLSTPTSVYFQTAGTSTPYVVEIEVWTK